MNQKSKWIVAVAAALFIAGVVIGHYAVPTSVKKNIAAEPTPTSKLSSTRISKTQSLGKTDADPSRPQEPDIFARIKELLARSRDGQRRERFNEIAQLIDEKNVRDVLAYAQRIEGKRQRYALTLLVIGRWAEFDPQSAIVYAQNDAPASVRNWATASALHSWAQRDRSAATAWAQQLPLGQVRDQTIQVILASLAEQDPQSAFTVLQNLPAERDVAHFYWPIFSRWAANDPEAAASQAAQLTSASSRETALQAIGSAWSKQNPKAAFAWANNLQPDQGRDRALQTILLNWASKIRRKLAGQSLLCQPAPRVITQLKILRGNGRPLICKRRCNGRDNCPPATTAIELRKTFSRVGSREIRLPPKLSRFQCRRENLSKMRSA